MPSMPNTAGDAKCFARLPKNVVPQRYNLTLKPDLDKFTFAGKQLIDIRVVEATNKIVLNALDLKIISASFVNKAGKAINALNFNVCDVSEVATINFPAALEPGEGQLSIEYEGNLNDKLKGFYRSKYTTPEGLTKYAATTKFEPTHARRAFPCWDEPAIKSKFDITLIAPKDRVALSNTNVISEKADADPNYKVVKFATSPIMSTYLVAFIVGEYDFVEDVSADGVKVRVYTPLTKKEQGRFSLEVAVKSLNFYKNYFSIAYPLPKMDLIAIADFASGAMENWGLVTFRETCLLFDSKNTSVNRKRWIALVVGHELAHQWFGNLVTMEWWTHLWLNEGFASFIEYLCCDNFYPDFKLWTQFVTDVVERALNLDGLHTSHPIEVPVGHPSEISAIFDEISYSKGASIIRMLHNYLGDKLFRDGLSSYLKKFSYKNAETEDLWQSLEEVSKKPIGNMMSTWTKQKGFPVISVASRQEGNNRILTLTQEKFSSNGKLDNMDKATLWSIPISISMQSNPSAVAKQLLLESRSTEIQLDNVPENLWVKINPGSFGFYRVNYPPQMLDQLLPAIKDKSLPPLDRLGLQSDLFAMVKAGKTSTVEILKLLEAFIDEDDCTVWNSISTCLGELNTLLSHTDFQDMFHAFGRKLLSKIHAKLGWDAVEGESHMDTLLRNIVIGRLVSFKDENVIAEAKKRFEAHVNGTFVIPADIRLNVYCAVARDCDEKTFELLFSLFRNADLHEEKNRVCYALATVKDPQKLEKVLNFAISDEVRSQDSAYVIVYAASTKDGREMAWRFFRDNHKLLHSRYESGFIICNLVKAVTQHFASETKAQEVQQFFSENPTPAAERSIQQSIESIRLKADWLTRDSATIKAYLMSAQ